MTEREFSSSRDAIAAFNADFEPIVKVSVSQPLLRLVYIALCDAEERIPEGKRLLILCKNELEDQYGFLLNSRRPK